LIEPTPEKRLSNGGLVLWRIGAALLLGLYATLLVRANSYVAGGADSSGYLNAARLLSRGRVVEPVELVTRLDLTSREARLFIPLGFVPAAGPATMAPYYPPGLPLHMASIAALGGWTHAPFLVGPLAALAALVLFFSMGRELGLSRTLSAAGTLLLASCPIFFGMAIQPMSDVPATAWVLAALLFGLRARRDDRWAILCGVAFGMAVLVRPTDLLAAPAAALALPARRGAIAKSFLAALPFAILLAAYNTTAFGSAAATGYGSTLAWSLSARNVLPEIRNYGYWIPVLLTPLLPLCWIAVVVDRRVPRRDRALLFLWFGSFFAFYCFYQVYEDWWSTRFLLPGIPAMILATAILARDLPLALENRNLLRGLVRRRTVIGIALLVAILAIEVNHIRRFDLLGMARGETVYRDASRWAASSLPSGSLLVAMQMSGALKYYTGLPIVRWDSIDPGRFQALRQSLEAHGLHWYALLWPFEATDFRKRLPGPWTRIGVWRDIGLWRLD